MTITATLHHDVPRETRRRETTRLFDEATCARRIEREDLIEQVILMNTGVARSIARRYVGRGIPLEDLEQVAYLALVRAARKFDGDKADDFLTYAVPTIRGEIKRHFRDLGWTVRPPRRIQELQTGVLRMRETLRDDSGRVPTPAEIATKLGVDESDVVEALTAEGCFTPLSLDAPVSSGEPEAASLGDLLPEYDADLSVAEARALLAPALGKLTEREQVIVRLRFVDDLTQAEIGERIGVTQMQVSRLLAGILGKLRESIAPDGKPIAA
ncbi:sigma-70 family RNA polymerase sigma factor [Nocardioides sp. AN3]